MRNALGKSGYVGIALLVFELSSTPGVWAGAPTEQLRGHIDEVSRILKDPALKAENKAPQRQAAIQTIADQIFDFEETAKQSLGRHWDKRTVAERQEFVQLFTNLIQRSYLSKVERYDFDKMLMRGESIDGDRATVRTKLLLGPGSELGLDYQMMHNSRDRWQVYDITIEGLSLVANYRAQFNKVIRTSSYEDLLVKLKSKQAEFSAPSATPTTTDPKPR